MDIEVGGQRGCAEDCVQQKVDADDPDGDVWREPDVGIAIEQTDKEQNDCVPDHGVAVSDAVSQTSDQWAAKDIYRGAGAQ